MQQRREVFAHLPELPDPGNVILPAQLTPTPINPTGYLTEKAITVPAKDSSDFTILVSVIHASILSRDKANHIYTTDRA